MGFRGQDYAFDSPTAAVAGMVARLAGAGAAEGWGSAARPPEIVVLDAARGRVLAEDVRADRDSPAFDYSAMDGYAVRAADVEAAFRRADAGGSITLAVVGESRIGAAPPVLRDALHGADMSAAPAGVGVMGRDAVIENIATQIQLVVAARHAVRDFLAHQAAHVPVDGGDLGGARHAQQADNGHRSVTSATLTYVCAQTMTSTVVGGRRVAPSSVNSRTSTFGSSSRGRAARCEALGTIPALSAPTSVASQPRGDIP